MLLRTITQNTLTHWAYQWEWHLVLGLMSKLHIKKPFFKLVSLWSNNLHIKKLYYNYVDW